MTEPSEAALLSRLDEIERTALSYGKRADDAGRLATDVLWLIAHLRARTVPAPPREPSTTMIEEGMQACREGETKRKVIPAIWRAMFDAWTPPETEET